MNTAQNRSLIGAAQAQMAKRIDALFARHLAGRDQGYDRLCAAMAHAAIDGGKRLRPLLVDASSRLFPGKVAPESVLHVGAAVEAIHVYSLIHDDLPAMDDDDLRRGKPTVHRAFDDATAILAGDALQSLAFTLLATPEAKLPAAAAIALVASLARAAGADGMVGGQMMDIAASAGPAVLDLPGVQRLQALKTGALIAFAIESGGQMAGANPEDQAALGQFARNLGIAFQIADDLLDVSGDPALAGKALNKDQAAGKITFVTHLGVDGAKAEARRLVEEGLAVLDRFGQEAELMRALASYMVERDR